MKCNECGAPVENGKCVYCGKDFPVNNTSNYNQYPNYQQNTNYANNMQPQNIIINNTVQNTVQFGKRKNKYVALLLCLFLGGLGAHKFYEGKIGMGILYLFTVGLFGIGWFLDFIILIFKSNPYYV